VPGGDQLADSVSAGLDQYGLRPALNGPGDVLGDLPILGTFFKNLNYTQEETELVIIVTPRLVHPLPASTNLEALLPGARSEQRNAGKVWLPYLAGGMNQDTAVPGFSY
jgi:pilus assembly protein CpaC